MSRFHSNKLASHPGQAFGILLDSPMKEKLIAFAQMTRMKESLPVLVFSTLLGVASTQSTLDWDIIMILVANTLLSCAGFTLHALQFAPLDIVDTEKRLTNPIATGVFSTRLAIILSVSFGVIALVFYAMLGSKVLLTGLVLVAVLTLINWRKLGLHRHFYLKPGTYQWLIHGFFCLLGSLIQNESPSQISLMTLGMVATSLLFIILTDEAQVAKNKAQQRWLIIASFVCLSLLVLVSVPLFFMLRLLPYWVLALFVVLSAILLVPQFLERQRERLKPLFDLKPLRIALYRAAAISLAVHFITPFLYQLFK